MNYRMYSMYSFSKHFSFLMCDYVHTALLSNYAQYHTAQIKVQWKDYGTN